MNDESLSKVLAKLEEQIGKERMSTLRRSAAKRGVHVLTLLGESVVIYLTKISTEEAA